MKASYVKQVVTGGTLSLARDLHVIRDLQHASIRSKNIVNVPRLLIACGVEQRIISHQPFDRLQYGPLSSTREFQCRRIQFTVHRPHDLFPTQSRRDGGHASTGKEEER